MAFKYWEETTKKKVWGVPAPAGFGAVGGEIDKAWDVAVRSYKNDKGILYSDSIPEDVIRILPGDDEILIFYVVDLPA